MEPALSPESRRAYDAVRQHIGVFRRHDRGRLMVAGADRASYLQGLLTNDILALVQGTGCYAAYLTPQGRMIADLRVYELGETLLLCVPLDVKDKVLGLLDQFLFSEDVQLGDVTKTWSGVVAAGPAAAETLGSILSQTTAAALAGLPEHGNLRAAFREQPVIALRLVELGVPAWELLVETAHVDQLGDAVLAAGAERVDDSAAEALRIEAGVPRFRTDMDEETIPLEAGIDAQAISLTKGCYVGQEVIIRVLHRGHGRVARKLMGLVVDGDRVPRPGALVFEGGREVGRVTSSTPSPLLGRPIALAYLHRDVAAPGTRVALDDLAATVTATPFVQPAGG